MSFQTHAHHCMLISHGLLYMVMSKGLHVIGVFFTCNWTVCCMYWTGVSGVGSMGAVGATFVRGPHETLLSSFRVFIIWRVLHDFKTPLFQLIVVMRGSE